MQASITSVTDKVIIVTGGLGDIGFRVVQALLRQKATCVCIVDIKSMVDIRVMEKVIELNKQFGQKKYRVYRCDVRNKDTFSKCWKLIAQDFKSIDVLINLAGIWNDKTVDLMIDINFKATVNCTLVAIDNMGIHKNGKGGIVINFAGFKAFENCSDFPVYAAANRAIVSFVRAMEKHNDKLGMRIVCLCPLIVDTKLSSAENLKNCTLDFIELSEQTTKAYRQKPTAIGLAVEDMIMRAKNGAVWGIGFDQPPFLISQDELKRSRIPYF